ncbi:MAG: hypothetical protein KDI46_01390 [Alphaproteobacteria bacterium]|nr:hypothetical protein [Alphaproteobacteria bacterium]
MEIIPKAGAKLQQNVWPVTPDFAYCGVMPEKSSVKSRKQDKLDKRAAALRANLRKRKAPKKDAGKKDKE